MRTLTVPNWSFGRDRDLLGRFRTVLEDSGLTLHYLQSDVDHNRTVSAFSGEDTAVLGALERLCELAFERIDLNRHVGVHPRIGALDVCPFVPLPEIPSRLPVLPGSAEESAINTQPSAASGAASIPPERLLAEVETFAAKVASRYQVPVFLYEKSERGRHEADLPSLRKGGFGSLEGQELNPDFGPSHVHPQLGVSVIGIRDFLTAINVNLAGEDPAAAKAIAQEIRSLRASGDHRFLGVRALGFPLASMGMSQVCLNLTLPDITAVDPIVGWVMGAAADRGRKYMGTELVGVIRRGDLPGATRLKITDAQVIDV
jgi:glutamate formiminotransferase